MTALYYAVYLNEESHQMLLAAVPAIHKNVYAEHITVAFKPSPEKVFWLERARSDKYVELTVIGMVFDDRGQAVSIKEPVRLDDGIAHITISCADGTKPAYSNSMFTAIPVIKLSTTLKLLGTLEPARMK